MEEHPWIPLAAASFANRRPSAGPPRKGLGGGQGSHWLESHSVPGAQGSPSPWWERRGQEPAFCLVPGPPRLRRAPISLRFIFNTCSPPGLLPSQPQALVATATVSPSGICSGFPERASVLDSVHLRLLLLPTQPRPLPLPLTSLPAGPPAPLSPAGGTPSLPALSPPADGLSLPPWPKVSLDRIKT